MAKPFKFPDEHVQGTSPAEIIREVKRGDFDGTVVELGQEKQSPDWETSGAPPIEGEGVGARPTYEGANPWPPDKPLEQVGKPFKNLK